MSSTETSHCPVEDRLKDLIGRGYQFIHPCDAEGRVIAVVGVRAHDTVIDVVRLNAEDDVVATRVPGDEPDILEPHKVLWRSAGEANGVLDELLSLPDDDVPTDREPVKGCWIPGTGGRAKWLASAG